MFGVKFKRVVPVFLILSMCLLLVSCSGDSTKKETDVNISSSKTLNIGLMTDKSDINDGSFNQCTFEALKKFEKDGKAKISYVIPKDDNDFVPTLDGLVDKNRLIFSTGFNLDKAVLESAKNSKSTNFVLIDAGFEKPPSNVTGVTFKAEQSSFLVGYIAAKTTKTNKVGFVGGMKGLVNDQFEFGYKAGVKQASKELGKDVEVIVQLTEDYKDAAKGKTLAMKMLSAGCDIIFHACGGAGDGVIEAVKEANKFVIGVDMDQSSKAPDNVLTSALKDTGKAAKIIIESFMKDEKSIGGKNYDYGLKEGCVGIPENNKNMSPEVYKDVMKIKGRIVSGEITPPSKENDFKTFVSKL